MLMCIPEKFQNNKTNGSHLSHYSNRAGASVNIHFVNVLKLNAMYSDFRDFPPLICSVINESGDNRTNALNKSQTFT